MLHAVKHSKSAKQATMTPCENIYFSSCMCDVCIEYLVKLHVDFINSPLGHLHLLSQLLLHALLLIE